MPRTHPVLKPRVDGPKAVIPENFGTNDKMFNQNYSGANLSRRSLRGVTFMYCCFDDADMTDADCTGTEFLGSTFRRTVCRGTNFTNAKLHRTVFEPSDFYNMTMTFACQTYEGMKLSRAVWDGYLFFALGLMQPPQDDDGFDPRSPLIGAMGQDYYLEHFAKFKNRTL